MTETTTETPLSARLRETTAEAHDRAENATFMRDLLEGRLDAAAWQQMLGQLKPVYAALEEVGERMRAEHPEVPMFHPGLNRGAAIEHDLAALEEITGESTAEPGPEAEAYAERIRSTDGDVHRYLAHHYTRYLGDLSGGQAMRVLFQRHYDLPEDALTFFAFDEIEGPVPFKRAYRAGIDALPSTEEQAQALMAEARESFDANRAMFAALETAAS